MKVYALIRYARRPLKEFEEIESLRAVYSSKEAAQRALLHEDADDVTSYDIEEHEVDAGPERTP